MRKPGNSDPFKFSPEMRAQDLRFQFERHGAFFVYDLELGDKVEIGISERYLPGIRPDRTLVGELVGRGAFGILQDTDGLISDSVISFGTYAYSHGPIEFTKPGILRGYICPEGALALDLAGKDFFNEGTRVEYYPDVYSLLRVNGIGFF